MRGSLDGTGINAKYFLKHGFAFEAQINAGGLRAIDGQSIYAVSLIEYHLQLPIPSLRIFFGGGLHAGWWASRPESDYIDEGIFGLDGVGGLEYLFASNSFGISGDIRPSINYIQEVEFLPHNVIGIAVRYYFGSNKVKPFEYPNRIRKKYTQP
jgi:hypothetical protein